MIFRLKSLECTNRFGEKLGGLLKSGDVVCLNGDLGSGKTTLTKAIGLGMGIQDYITSPTFALINEYKGEKNLYHFDTYRLENAEEAFDLGFEDYFYGNGVCVVEWAKRIEKFLPENSIIINIKYVSESVRILEIEDINERTREIIGEMEACKD